MIYIWVRRRIDWEDEEAALAQLGDASKVPLWNATFNISYQRFRGRVAEIAQLSHSRVEGAESRTWDEIPDGEVVLPVDDDDWFAPNAARVLEAEHDPNTAGYHWPSRWIEVPIDFGHRLGRARRRLRPSAPPKWLCSTNNYAMVKTPATKELLLNHVRASRWFEKNAGSVKHVEGALSVANRTLASQTTLGRRPDRTLGRGELLRKYRRHRRLYRRPLPDDLEWCRPYVELMAELMDELEI